MNIIKKWFQACNDSIKGYVNPKELIKAVITGITTGGTLLAILETLKATMPVWWVEPTTAALLTGVLALLIELARRFSQGKKVDG